eukprot:1195913-Prorocentrum_minimum.AAC.15
MESQLRGVFCIRSLLLVALSQLVFCLHRSYGSNWPQRLEKRFPFSFNCLNEYVKFLRKVNSFPHQLVSVTSGIGERVFARSFRPIGSCARSYPLQDFLVHRVASWTKGEYTWKEDFHKGSARILHTSVLSEDVRELRYVSWDNNYPALLAGVPEDMSQLCGA